MFLYGLPRFDQLVPLFRRQAQPIYSEAKVNQQCTELFQLLESRKWARATGVLLLKSTTITC